MFTSRSLVALLSIALLANTYSLAVTINRTYITGHSSTADGDSFSSSPDQAEAGKETVLKYTLGGCSDAWNGQSLETAPQSISELNNDGITIINNGAKISFANAECSVEIKIQVSKHTPAGTYKFRIRAAIDGAEFREISVKIQSIALPPRGPIPTASPEVDVMWHVMPTSLVKDNYGRTIAKRYYGVEVVIGNNSGYELQIAAVGFNFGPQGPYADALTAVETEIAKNQKSLALGLGDVIRAGIEQCNNDPGHLDKKRRGSGEGTTRTSNETQETSVDKCVEVVIRTALEGLKTKNEAASKLIADVRQTATEMSRAGNQRVAPSSSYQVARGSATHGQFWDWRNLTIKAIDAIGGYIPGFSFIFGAAQQLRFEQWTSIAGSPLSQAFGSVLPDETVRRLQQLDDQILRDGKLIANNHQDRTRILIPKKLLDLDPKKVDDVPYVTRALGDLVLIGNKIQYINRVNVTSGASGEIVPEPSGAPLNTRYFLGQTAELNISGTNLLGADFPQPPQGVSVSGIVATKTSIKAELKIDRNMLPDTYRLHLVTKGGSVPFEISIIQPPLVAKEYKITGTSDNKLFPGDTNKTLEINGEFLRNVTLLPGNSDASKITLGNYTYSSSDPDSMSVQIVSVPKDLAAGKYPFELVAPKGAEKSVKVQVLELEVKSPPKPKLTNINWDPNNTPVTTPGQIVSGIANIVGENLDKAEVSTNHDTSKVKVNIKTQSSTEMKVEFAIADDVNSFEVYLADHQGGQKSKVADLKVTPQPDVTLAKDSETLSDLKPGKVTPLLITGTHLQGARVTNDDVIGLPKGWVLSSEPVEKDGLKLIVNVTPPEGEQFSNELTFIIRVKNFSKKVAEFKVTVPAKNN